MNEVVSEVVKNSTEIDLYIITVWEGRSSSE